MLNVYFPESRARENKLIIQDSDDNFRQALHRSVIELRDNTRPNDHKFRSLPGNSLWISDIAGRKGGRLLYFKKNNQLIIWGLGPDHNIEDEAERYFNSKEKENQVINGALCDVTADFLNKQELNEIQNKTRIFAGNLSDNFLKEKLLISDYQISEIRKCNEMSLWNLNTIDAVCRYKLWQYHKLPENILLSAGNEDHLFGFIHGTNEKLMIHLDEYQDEIIKQTAERSYLLKGETGSGKTTILIYKAIYYAQAHPDKECILFTFNLALANMIKEAIEELNGILVKNLNIYGLFDWVESLSDCYLDHNQMIEKDKSINRYAIFDSLYDQKTIKILKLKDPGKISFFLKKEIDEVIMEYGLQNSKDYLNHKRHGRDRRLGKNQRLAIWDIYEKYLDLLSEKKWTTYPLMMLSMLQVIQKPDFEFKMDALFVDEIQDMTPVSIKIISALRKDNDALCILAGDFKQSIYRKSFRWDDVKLPFHGANVLTLKKNYRNTVQILDEAYRLTQHFKIRWVQPISCGRNGKPVERIVYQPENKISKICSLIQFAVTDQKIEYSDIAVFGASSKIENIVELLVKEDIPAVLIRNQDNHYQKNAVKVSTLHSAKGLEFRMVILIDIETELMNFRCDDEKLKENIAVKLLYVGMTRAYDCLFFMLKENLNPQSKLDHFLYKIKQ